MKTTIQILLLFAVIAPFMACKPSVKVETETAAKADAATPFDSLLAQKLGADEYGMRKYVVAFLKNGPNRDQDSATLVEMQKGHMDNINRMAESGELVMAGPFMDNGELRGLYIFNVTTVEEAAALTETDPMIKAGRLVMELHPWYGSAAITEMNGLHKRIQKSTF